MCGKRCKAADFLKAGPAVPCEMNPSTLAYRADQPFMNDAFASWTDRARRFEGAVSVGM
jgi:hypothetical protein